MSAYERHCRSLNFDVVPAGYYLSLKNVNFIVTANSGANT